MRHDTSGLRLRDIVETLYRKHVRTVEQVGGTLTRAPSRQAFVTQESL